VISLYECGRYSDILENLINSYLGGKEILFLNHENDYQGFVDIDVLLDDGRVFSYCYSYGSCSGCDGWEADGLDDAQIRDEMRSGGSFLDNINQYFDWCDTLEDRHSWDDRVISRKKNAVTLRERYTVKLPDDLFII